MAYIGFFDMLGIQSVAEYDYDEYRKSLEIFQEKVQFICESEAKKHPDNKIQIYIFSDCAYIESTSLIQLVDFYSMLRSELFIDGIFFNAALCEGRLNANTSISKHVTSTIFESINTVKVYQMQNQYKGIGITIDKEIINKYKDQIENKLVMSIFQPNAHELNFIEYWDIKYSKPSNKNLSLLLIIKYLLSTYSKLRRYNSKASRYYVAAINTIILQLDKEDIVIEENNELFATEITKYILKLENTDVSYNLFLLLFVNVLFDRICGNEKNTLLQESCFDLLDNFQIKNNNILREFKEISKIPNSILNVRGKELLSDYLNRYFDT